MIEYNSLRRTTKRSSFASKLVKLPFYLRIFFFKHTQCPFVPFFREEVLAVALLLEDSIQFLDRTTRAIFSVNHHEDFIRFSIRHHESCQLFRKSKYQRLNNEWISTYQSHLSTSKLKLEKKTYRHFVDNSQSAKHPQVWHYANAHNGWWLSSSIYTKNSHNFFSFFFKFWYIWMITKMISFWAWRVRNRKKIPLRFIKKGRNCCFAFSIAALCAYVFWNHFFSFASSDGQKIIFFPTPLPPLCTATRSPDSCKLIQKIRSYCYIQSTSRLM